MLTEQEGHSISTASLHTETIHDPESGEDVAWKSYLILCSLTYGLVIYEDKHISMILITKSTITELKGRIKSSSTCQANSEMKTLALLVL